LQQEYLQSQDEFDQIRLTLAQTLDHEPSYEEVFQEVYNKQSLRHAQNMNWGLYRNTRYKLACLQARTNRLELALRHLIEVSYLDANGAQNLGRAHDPEFVKEFPLFDPKHGTQAPGILTEIADTSKSLGLSEKELEQAFLKVARPMFSSLKLPKSPEDAWAEIANEIPWPES
ncbi:MAG: hypothetical protein AAB393_18380, partial [Bacteroidota bacterium]